MLTGALGTSGLVGATRNRQSIDSLEISGKSKTQGNSLGNTYLRKPPALAVQNGVEIKSPDIYGNYLTLKGGAYGGGDIPTMRIKSTGIVLGDAGNGCHIASNGQNADYGNMSFGYNGSIGSSVIAGFTVRGWCFLGATLPVYIGSTSVVNPNGVSLYAPSNYVLEQRFGTNAQTLRVFNTYTSSTSFENLQFKANSGAAYQIGSAIGSAGGTARAITFGHWNAAGTFAGSASISTTSEFTDDGGVSDCSRFGGTNIFFNSDGSKDSQVLMGLKSTSLGPWTSSCGGYNKLQIGASALGRAVYAASYSLCLGMTAGTSGTTGGYPSGPDYTNCIILNSSGGGLVASDHYQFVVSRVTQAFFGRGVTHATPENFTLNATGGSGTNIAGASFTLAGGKGTGTGLGGSLKFQVAPIGSSGSSANALVDVLVIDSTRLSTFTGPITLTQPVSTSGSPTAFTLTGAAHTTLTASTEATDVNVNLARTVQFATGALTTQRAMRIQAPTYGFVGASTITTASTLSISGPPVAGTNATITNAYALNVESGKSQFSGWTQIGTTDSWNLPLSVGGWVQMHASGYGELFFHCGNAAVLQYDVRVSTTGISVKNATSGSGFHWYAAGAGGASSLSLVQDASDVLAQRRGTNAQTLNIYNTYTSATSLETFRIKANAGAAYQIGSAIGSAGGTNRAIDFGHWNSGGTFTSQLSLLTTGVLYSTNAGSTAVLQTAGGVIIYGSFVNTPHLSLNGWWTGTQNSNGGINFGSGQKLVWGSSTSNATASGTSGDIGLARNAAGVLEVNTGTIGTLASITVGSETITQVVATTGSPTAFTLTGAAHTTLALSTEATDVNFNLSRTVQFATGALTTQRAMRVQAPTYSFVGASTITTASTLSISGPPVAGTNATITNAYALNVESGYVNIAGAGGSAGIRFANAGTYWAPNILASNQLAIGSQAYIYIYHSNSHYMTFYNGSISTAGSLIGMGSAAYGSTDVNLNRDSAGVLNIRNGTNAQTVRVTGTWTSSTSYETINIKGKAAANFEIGPENGSAGGTLRGLTIGGYSAGTTTIAPWLTFTSGGNASFPNPVNFAHTDGVTSNGSYWIYNFGAAAGFRNLRANGTSSLPTQVLSGNVLGFYSARGYYISGASGAYHTTHGGYWGFNAAEDFTSGAQGTTFQLLTTTSGSATPTERLFIDSAGVTIFNGEVRILSAAKFSKLISQNSAEITNTPSSPSGTTQTITLNNGNHQTLTLTSATGAVTVTLTVPSNVSSGTIIVKQHASTVRDITWEPAGTIKWMGTEPDWAADAVNDIRIVSWRYDGSVMYLMSTDKAA